LTQKIHIKTISYWSQKQVGQLAKSKRDADVFYLWLSCFFVINEVFEEFHTVHWSQLIVLSNMPVDKSRQDQAHTSLTVVCLVIKVKQKDEKIWHKYTTLAKHLCTSGC